jgi:hypothetical protein
MEVGTSPEVLDRARSNAELGLPLPLRTRLRFVRRLIARLIWPLLRHQTDFNKAVLFELSRLMAEGETSFSRQLAEMGQRLDALSVRTDLIQRQAFLRHEEGVAAVRDDFAQLRAACGSC